MDVYFYVSYNDKEHAKSLGCKWSPQKKLWYIDADNTNISTMYKMYRVCVKYSDECV